MSSISRVNQNELILTLRRLYPEMQKRAAKDVLLEHAEEVGMSPSQLRRLGENLNTHRQLLHMKNASLDDRGATVPLLNVMDLVESYESTPPAQAKAASRRETILTDENFSRHVIPLQESEGMVKAAAHTAPEPIVDHRDAEVLEEVYNQIGELRVKEAAAIGRLMDLTESPTGWDLQMAEEDALHLEEEGRVKQACARIEVIAAKAKNGGRPVHRFTGELRPRIMEVHSEVGDLLVKAADYHRQAMRLEKLASTVDEEPDLQTFASMDGDEMLAYADRHGIDVDATLAAGNIVLKASPTTTSAGPPVGSGVTFSEDDPQDNGDDSGKGQSLGQGKNKGGSAGEATIEGTPPISGLSKLITVPAQAISRGLQTANAGAQSLLDKATGKDRQNTDQRRVDEDVADITRKLQIRRLIGNDAVLREHPQKEVLAAYNAIAEMNPDLAASPQRVLLALRESVAYEGLTLDAQKSMADVRKVSAEGDAKDEENARRKYNISSPTTKPSK